MDNSKNKYVKRIKRIFFHKSEATVFIWNSIKSQRKNLSLNIISGILNAFLEGISLGIIYLLVKIISSSSSNLYDWSNNIFIKPFPTLYNYLNSLEFRYIFILLIVLALIAQVIQSYFKYLNLLSAKYIEAKCLSDVTKKIYSQIFRFSYRCSSQYKVGDLSEFIIQCPETIRLQIEQFNIIFISLIVSFTYILFLINLNSWLFFGVILIVFISKSLQDRLIPRVRKISNEVTNIKVEISKSIVESFQALRYIYSSGLSNIFRKKLNNQTNLLENRLRKRARKITLVDPVLSAIPILLISFIGILLVFIIERESIFSILTTFVIAIQRLNIRIISISGAITNLSDNLPRVLRLNQIISKEKNEFKRIGGINFEESIKRIVFSNVSFSYNVTDKFCLENINFSLERGSINAIVGKTGSGKSSILDLLLGLYEPIDGDIKINDYSLSKLNLDSWQQRISMVSQDIFLFNTSIKNNLTMGFDDISWNDIEEACLNSGLLDVIKKLPQNFDTIIGERGFQLSGGQRQRLAIARALLRKRDILILDEATSALDSYTENQIQRNIYELKNEKIILIVAHRLSTIKKADKILVLNSGKISEHGKHQELLQMEGLYSQLWDIQTKK